MNTVYQGIFIFTGKEATAANPSQVSQSNFAGVVPSSVVGMYTAYFVYMFIDCVVPSFYRV